MIIALTGGLGNQLFQVAACLYATTNDKAEVLTNLAAPRSTNNIVDVLHFDLDEHLLINNQKFHSIDSKIFGFNLRQGISPTNLEEIVILRKISQLATSLYFSFRLKKKISVYSANNVGYSNIENLVENTLLVGYFQTNKFLLNEKVLTKLKKIKLLDEKQQFLKLKKDAEIERPIVVHMRLGDYLKFDKFGVLGTNYYERSLDRIYEMRKTQKNNIWVFSDDTELARNKFPKKYEEDVCWIENEGSSPAQVLDLMRHGTDFVLANSSFSWWSAMLAYKPNIVVAPSKWFLAMEDPLHLKPKYWFQENPYFD